MDALFIFVLSSIVFFLSLLHHHLMRTLVLLHMLNSGRQEPDEMTCKDMRLATHASATAVNPDMLYKLQQMPKSHKKLQ